MVELKIQSSTDREKLVTALANSGYAVRVVSRKKGMIENEYFVQILDANNVEPVQIHINPSVKITSSSDARQVHEYIWQGISNAHYSNLV